MRSCLQTFGILLITSLDFGAGGGRRRLELYRWHLRDRSRRLQSRAPTTSHSRTSWWKSCRRTSLSRQGITSPRKVHCKFKAAEKAGDGWTVKSECEEMGEGAPYDLKVTAGSDGSLSISNEDVWGPDPQVFKLCQK